MNDTSNNEYSGRIHSLDGLRALAIVLVIAKHLSSGHSIRALDYLWRFELLGDMGVRIFFVISGFLITTLLRREYRANGRIDLKSFYFRRALRIWPAYYFFLAVMTISSILGYQIISTSEIAGVAIFLPNYLGAPLVLAHTWSLAVEEQFYLIWPFIVVALGWRLAPILVVAFCLSAPIMRGLIAFNEIPVPFFWSKFETAGDAIAWGCLYALVKRWRLPFFSPVKSALNACAALIILVFLSMGGIWPMAWNCIGTVIANLSVIFLIHNTLSAEGTLVYRLLNSYLMRALGTLSYSLYLWQQAFIYGGFKLSAPLNILMILLMAILSYQLIEKPFLRLKDRLPLDGRRPAPTPS